MRRFIHAGWLLATISVIGLMLGPPSRASAEGAVSNTEPHLDITEATETWTHEHNAPFQSMVLDIKYAASAALPPVWPQDELMLEVRDATAAVLQARPLVLTENGGGGGSGAFAEGSAVGCGYFSSSKEAVEPAQLHVVAYLAEHPTVSVTQPFTVSDQECSQTELEIHNNPHYLTVKQAVVSIDLLNRAPNGTGVSGLVTFTIDEHTKLAFPVKLPGDTLERNLAHWLHRGVNSVQIGFTPSDPAYAVPTPKLIEMRLPRTEHPVPRRHKRRLIRHPRG
jgi:hypothetical protein